MAEIIQEEKGKGGKRKRPKHPPHIDMTPMVDLACLLITFFMLTTAFTKPKAMEIVIPDPPKINAPQPPIPKWRAMHILLTKNNKIYWYMGKVEDKPTLKETGFNKNGIRKILLEKNIQVL